MKRISLAPLIAAVCVSITHGLPFAQVPAVGSRAANVKGIDVKILPASYLREYDPITLFFSKDVVQGDVGPVKPSSGLWSIAPAHSGELVKIDSRTLEFRPAAPWEPLCRYRVVSQKSAFELVTFLPLPLSVFPAPAGTGLEPVSVVDFVFSVKVDPLTLSRLVNFEVCALPGIEGRDCRTLDMGEYKVAEIADSGGGGGYRYRFTFNEPVNYGHRVKISLRLAEGGEFRDARREYAFETMPEFAMERAGTYGYMYALSRSGVAYDARQAVRFDSGGAFTVEFSAPPADPGFSAMRNMVSMAPAPSGFKYRIDGNRIIFNPAVEREKLYKITLNPTSALKDLAGRGLANAKPSSFFAYLPKTAPSARWGRGRGVVERLGPQYFPIKTEGVSSLDLRVYKIGPLERAFAVFSRSQVAVYESNNHSGGGGVSESPAVIDSTANQIYRYGLEQQIKTLGSPKYSAVIDISNEKVSERQSIDLKPILAAAYGKDKSGSYLVGFRLLDGSSERYYARVDVTDLCLSAVDAGSRVLFAVTSFANGKPVSDVSIKIEGVVNNEAAVLAQGKTGTDGFFSLEYTKALREKISSAGLLRIVAAKGDDVLILDGDGTDAARDTTGNYWHWANLDWLRRPAPEFADNKTKLRGFVRAERSVYGLDDTVRVKGYVRETFHGAIKLPPSGTPFSLLMESAAQTYTRAVTLNEFGSFDAKIALRESPAGEYRLSLFSIGPDGQKSLKIASTDFTVQPYGDPRFEVTLRGAARISNESPVAVQAAASYYNGGNVANQEIAWKITPLPYAHRPRGIANLANYVLSTDRDSGAQNTPNVFETNGKTDGNGGASITYNPQTPPSKSAVEYVIEAAVIDSSRQAVSARHTVVALPPLTLALRASRHIKSGSTISARVAAVDVNDSLIVGQKVAVELKRISLTPRLADSDFSSGSPEYTTVETVEPVEKKNVRTKDKPLPVEFKNQEAGAYILELSSRDRSGRRYSVKTDIYLVGGRPQPWKKQEQDTFETVSDRNTYEPGQQAKILLKSPYRKAAALAVVERPSGDITYKWVDIVNGQGTFTLDIKQEMAPSIPVSFLLMRPRESMPRRAQEDAGRPEAVGRTIWLAVSPVANMLDVRLVHAPLAAPGATLDVTVSLRDIQGKPRGGEAILWLVDETAILWRKEKNLDPLEAFLEEAASNITIRDSRNLERGYNHDIENRSAVIDDSENGSAPETITLRKNIKTVPYWNPSITIDKSGNAAVQIPIPPNLTNYSLRAMAISGSDKFGTAKNRVSARRPE